MKVTGQLCADNTALGAKVEAQRNEIAVLRRHLDTIGAMLIPQRGSQTFTRLPHEIEEAARQHAQGREVFVEIAKVIGLTNANPQYLIAKVTDLRDTVDTRNKQLDEVNAILARFRKALVVANSPKLDPAAELEEIRAIVLRSLKRAEMVPTTPLITLVGELAGAHDSAVVERDEMAQEMAREVHPEDVAQGLQTLSASGLRRLLGASYDREAVRDAIVKDIDAVLTASGILPGNPLRGIMVGYSGWARRAADAACDRFEGLIKLPLEAQAIPAEDDGEGGSLFESVIETFVTEMLAHRNRRISAQLVDDIEQAVREQYEDEDDGTDEAVDIGGGEVITLNDDQLDELADRIARKMRR